MGVGSRSSAAYVGGVVERSNSGRFRLLKVYQVVADLMS